MCDSHIHILGGKAYLFSTHDRSQENSGFCTSWGRIKGEWYFAASDGIVKMENDGGFEIGGIRDGSYLYFPNVSGMRQNALMFLRAAVGGRSCTVEVREDSPFGAVLGCCRIQSAGDYRIGTYADLPCRLENTHGTHGLCFVFRGEGDDLLRFDGFRFEQIRP